MNFVCLAWLLAVSPAAGGQHGATLAPVALYTNFQHQAPAAVREALRDELAAIMSPLGLRFEWHDLNAARTQETAVELAVVTFKGSCEAGSPTVPAARVGALGWTHVSEGEILPFADIDCDGIRSFLSGRLSEIRPLQREEMYGRAVARVLAHELYHIFANTQHHGAAGVGKAAYTVENLTDAEFQFDGKESKALLTSKFHEILSAAGDESSR